MAYVKNWPVEGQWVITQTFDEHIDYANAHGLCTYYGQHGCHNYYFPALDIGCPMRTNIYAVHGGSVTVNDDGGTGYGVHIKLNAGAGILWVYAHLSAALVKTGDYVYEGDLIGLSGSTGNSTGPHLHWEKRVNGRPVNPQTDESLPPADLTPVQPAPSTVTPKVIGNGSVTGRVWVWTGSVWKLKSVPVYTRGTGGKRKG